MQLRIPGIPGSGHRKTPSMLRISTMAAALSVLVLAGGAGCDKAKAEPSSLTLSRENLGEARGVFNAGSTGTRFIVFFSSGCASCDTGSAALQKMLETFDGAVTVLAVWEPISAKDPAPTPHLLGNLPDKRVHQLWDPDHIMSAEMRASELAHPGSPSQARTRTDKDPEGLMYDTVALFKSGARWESTLPAPDYLEVGLEAILPEVRGRLVAMSGAK
jgi:hypothetical protein